MNSVSGWYLKTPSSFIRYEATQPIPTRISTQFNDPRSPYLENGSSEVNRVSLPEGWEGLVIGTLTVPVLSVRGTSCMSGCSKPGLELILSGSSLTGGW